MKSGYSNGAKSAHLALLPCLVLVLGGCHKSVHTELVIPAPPERIWAELTNEDGYSQWHPVIAPVEGSFVEGDRVVHRMTMPSGETTDVEARVVRLEENRLLNQKGGLPLVLTFNHTFRLDPVEGGTRLVQHEEYRGIWVPFWDPSWVESGYMKANEALRDRVASSEQESDPIRPDTD